MNLALYGHPFSSYTWKVLIALYDYDIPFVFRIVDADHPENAEVVDAAGPGAKFPVLQDHDVLLFEASAIIEYLSLHHAPEKFLLPEHEDAALAKRMLDRVFDNYVMTPMSQIVGEHIRAGGDADRLDRGRIAEHEAQLERSYAWLEAWLAGYSMPESVTLVECAAAPALFYADWICPIAGSFPRLADWRSRLLALPAVARCVEDARPYRALFPPGAPDRD